VNSQNSGPHLLKELRTAWNNQETMVRWLSRFFNYLDRCAGVIGSCVMCARCVCMITVLRVASPVVFGLEPTWLLVLQVLCWTSPASHSRHGGPHGIQRCESLHVPALWPVLCKSTTMRRSAFELVLPYTQWISCLCSSNLPCLCMRVTHNASPACMRLTCGGHTLLEHLPGCGADEVYRHTHERGRDALLDLIGREREHEQVDRDPIKSVINVFINVSMNNLDKYKEDFEAHLLTSVTNCYQAKAAEWIQSDSCAEYLKKAEACIHAEEERATSYLHPDSKKPVIAAAQEELLVKVQVRPTPPPPLPSDACFALLVL
jgi:hypothetical protein